MSYEFYTSQDGWRCVRRSPSEVKSNHIKYIINGVVIPLGAAVLGSVWLFAPGLLKLIGVAFVAAAVVLAVMWTRLFNYTWHGRLRRADQHDYTLDILDNIYSN